MHDVPKLVLVDDDELYREALSTDLADRGFAVSCFADAPSFLEAMDNGIVVHVALLDWVMPGMSGFELMGALRERGTRLPVVFLTGFSMVDRELRALDLGAVDFVDKARGAEVLARRLRVIIEAQRGQRATPVADATPEAEQHGDLTLHPATARASWRHSDVRLTMTEYKMVALLASRKGEPQTYRALYDAAHYAGFIAGSDERGHHTNVRSLVKRIRKKFTAIDSGFAEIENVAHVGYLWRNPRQ